MSELRGQTFQKGRCLHTHFRSPYQVQLYRKHVSLFEKQAQARTLDDWMSLARENILYIHIYIYLKMYVVLSRTTDLSTEVGILHMLAIAKDEGDLFWPTSFEAKMLTGLKHFSQKLPSATSPELASPAPIAAKAARPDAGITGL